MKPRSTSDTVATILLWIALVVVGGVGGFFSLFAVMATDRCGGSDDPCNYTTINAAFMVAWGGLALAAAVALGGTIWAASKKTTMFVWPLIGLVLVVVALVLGTALLNAGVGMDFAAAAVARR